MVVVDHWGFLFEGGIGVGGLGLEEIGGLRALFAFAGVGFGSGGGGVGGACFSLLLGLG